MIIFENGTLLENAYVEINGTKYPVQMPKYSGNTPISAENLNKVQNDLQKEIEIRSSVITAVAERQYITVSENWEKVNIPILEGNHIGNLLQVINNQIVIGSGISKVLVSASGVVSSEVAGDKDFHIFKNGESILNVYEGGNPDVLWRSIAIAPILVDVEEGDTFSLYLASGQPGEVEILKTILTIEVVR